MIFNNFWNKYPEGMTLPEQFVNLLGYTKKLDEGLDSKTDKNGDHKGSWQGLNKPTLSEEGMRATVEKQVEEISTLQSYTTFINDTINAETFGLVGDDKTDNTDKLNELLEYSFTNKKYFIYFPTGRYRINGTVKLRKNQKLIGNGYDSVLVFTHTDDCITLYDNSSAFCGLENITIDGNLKANRGVFLNRTDVVQGWDITRFTFKNVEVTQCLSHGVQIGSGADRSIMEVEIDNLFTYKNEGWGFYSLHATDGFFNKIIARQNKAGGVYAITTNCKFTNCKSYASGHNNNLTRVPGYILSGTLNQYVNLEAQENTSNGIEVKNLTSSTLLIASDRNGINADLTRPDIPIYSGVTFENSSNLDVTLSVSDSGKTIYDEYTQDCGFKLKGSLTDITINYNSRNLLEEYIIEGTTNNNIVINKSGVEKREINITPIITETTSNGVTYSVKNGQVYLNGTASSNTTINLFGEFGNPDNKIFVKGGNVIKLYLKDIKDTDNITLFIVTNTNVVSYSTNNNLVFKLPNDIEINNIFIRVNSGVTVTNKTLYPKLQILN